jgi:hypothetical protein
MKSFLLKPIILSLSFAFAVQSAVASGNLHEALSKRIDDHTVYEEFAKTPEGRSDLRAYRKDGKSLYAYFTEKAAKDISSSYKKILTNLLPAYFEGPVPSAHELDIQDHLGGLVDAPESFLTAYINSQGHNVAVLAAKGGSSNLLKVMRDKGANVAAMLENFVSTSVEHIADALFEIAPGLLVKSHFSDQITRLMVLALDDPAQYLGRTGYTGHKEPGLKAKLEHRGIKFDQKDIAGNTADSLAELVIDQDRKHAQRSILKIASGVLGEHSLDSHFWKRVTENPYGQLLGARNPQAFVDIALNAVLSQKQTPVRASFLQQNLSHEAEANEFWSSFLKTHDALEPQKSERLPDVLRVLKVARDFEDRSGFKGEEIRTLQSNIFANGGTFGVNFRKANRDEVELMISILTSLGRQKVKSGDSAHEIANSFFKSSSHHLNREQEVKLESHQINCAVMALHSAFDGDFDRIDGLLKSKARIVTYGSSQQRYDELMKVVS